MKYSLLIFILIVTCSAQASDIAREKRLGNEIVDSIMDGEALYLKSGDHSFLNIFMVSEAAEPRGAVIILHGRGFHPDWKDVVQPLRTGLPAHGWHTLSVQMPVLEKEAKYYDYVHVFSEAHPRLEAAIQFLKQKGVKRIILIAHSCSIHMSMDWFEQRQNPDKDLNGFAGIGMGATDYQQPMLQDFAFEKLSVPVLDIYGSNDYPAVTKKAAERFKKIQQAGNQKSAQRQIKNADHYFTDQGDALLKAVADWLATL